MLRYLSFKLRLLNSVLALSYGVAFKMFSIVFFKLNQTKEKMCQTSTDRSENLGCGQTGKSLDMYSSVHQFLSLLSKVNNK